jgi:hypothetical protein
MESVISDKSPLLATTFRWLDRDGWSPDVVEEEGGVVAAVGFRGDNGLWSCFAATVEDEDRVIFYSLYPEPVPEEGRTAVAELFTRVNFGLLIGNFELDLSDGEARYRTSIDVEGAELTDALLRQLVYANVAAMDHFLPAISAVAAGDHTPEETIAELGPT